MLATVPTYAYCVSYQCSLGLSYARYFARYEDARREEEFMARHPNTFKHVSLTAITVWDRKEGE